MLVWQNSQNVKFSFFLLIDTWSGFFGPEFCDLFVFQNPQEFYASHSLGQILVCAYTIFQFGKILISCTIPSGSPFLSSNASPCFLYMLFYCICLLCGKPSHLCPHRRSLHGIMSKVLDCGIIVSPKSSCTIMFTFRQIPLVKAWPPLSEKIN